MNIILRSLGTLLVVPGLMHLGAASASAQVAGAAGYNPYTGGYRAGASGYNPGTGTDATSRSYYNPYTGATAHVQGAYNPYTGRSAYHYSYRR
jgi:hypothetical protein